MAVQTRPSAKIRRSPLDPRFARGLSPVMISVPTDTAFDTLVAPHRGELLRHCYRMLGSPQDAEDAVQETLVKAWRALPRFEGRSAVRTWLHRIATNTCLNMIERNPRRVLRPATPPDDPRQGPALPLDEALWIAPLPDELVADEAQRPERRYEDKEALELAFVAALQHLTGRQRAVLVLREVLGFSGAEVAAMLDTNADSVYSLLQRAHRSIDDRLPAVSQQSVARELGDARLRDIARRYVAAWEDGDADALAAMLAEDAVLTMPPRPTWFRGRQAVRDFIAREPMARDRSWRLEPATYNGQLAFVTPRHSIQVLTLRGDGAIGEITTFLHHSTNV